MNYLWILKWTASSLTFSVERTMTMFFKEIKIVENKFKTFTHRQELWTSNKLRGGLTQQQPHRIVSLGHMENDRKICRCGMNINCFFCFFVANLFIEACWFIKIESPINFRLICSDISFILGSIYWIRVEIGSMYPETLRKIMEKLAYFSSATLDPNLKRFRIDFVPVFLLSLMESLECPIANNFSS